MVALEYASDDNNSPNSQHKNSLVKGFEYGTLNNVMFHSGNRGIDLWFTVGNFFVALLLRVAPWYKVEKNLTGNDQFYGCPLLRGTVIAPFWSGICDQYETLLDLPEGSGWGAVNRWSWVYLALSLVTLAFVLYETIYHGYSRGFDKDGSLDINNKKNKGWSSPNLYSFILNCVILFFLSLLSASIQNADAPKHTKDELPTTLLILAVFFTCIRIISLGLLMYLTYKYVKDENHRGRFGVGSNYVY